MTVGDSPTCCAEADGAIQWRTGAPFEAGVSGFAIYLCAFYKDMREYIPIKHCFFCGQELQQEGTQTGWDRLYVEIGSPGGAGGAYSYAELRNKLSWMITTLTWFECQIIKRRFGLNRDKQTLAEVGEAFSYSGARIGQIQQKSLGKLRHPSRTKVFKEEEDGDDQ